MNGSSNCITQPLPQVLAWAPSSLRFRFRLELGDALGTCHQLQPSVSLLARPGKEPLAVVDFTIAGLKAVADN